MNFTPNDLQNIEIKKSAWGYNVDAINDILSKIIEDYTAYIHESIEIKDKVSVTNEALKHYKNIEDSLQNTLIIAQQTGEDIKKNAYEKAENIVSGAELKAQKIVEEANDRALKIKFEIEELKKQLYTFKTKAEGLLLSQLELMKQIFESDNK